MSEQIQSSLILVMTILGIVVSISSLFFIGKSQEVTVSKRNLIHWNLLVSIWYLSIPLSINGFSNTPSTDLIRLLPVLFNLVVTASFLSLSKSFIKHPPPKLNPVILTMILMAGIGYLLSIPFSETQRESILPLLRYVVFAIWLSLSVITGNDLFQTLRDSQRPMHRNRIIYWSQTYIFEVLIGLVLFLGLIIPAGIMRLIQICILTYIVITHPLPDFRNSSRKILRFGLVSLSILFILFSSLMVYSFLISSFLNWNPVIAAGFTLFFLAILITSAISWISKMINQLLPDQLADLQANLREYNQKTGKLLDLHDFALSILELIDKTIEVERGYFFNVENRTADEKYQLRGYADLAGSSQIEILLEPSGPFFQTLFIKHQPVTQYDIDFLPLFSDTSIDLKRRLNDLEMEIFLPIVTKGQCIGVIALGKKESGIPYTPDEIHFLLAISDQSGIALENARLINGLTRLNNDYRRAYHALEKTNQNLEKAVRQLEKLDRVKTDFLTILSHELRTPMTLISGYAQLLLDEPDAQNDPVLKPLIEGIEDGTRRLEDIIQSILDMSAIDARSIEVHIQNVNIEELIAKIQTSLSAALEKRGITLLIDKPAMIPTIETDPNLLEKALYQLLTNAIKYSPNSSSIQLIILVQSSEQSPLNEPSIEFKIIDQGIGIDQEQIELIFNKFYQTQDVLYHSSGKTKYKGGGPGLGLAIVKGIITDLHGNVWAESHGYDEDMPAGSIFYIVLPIKREPTTKGINRYPVTFPVNQSSS